MKLIMVLYALLCYGNVIMDFVINDYIEFLLILELIKPHDSLYIIVFKQVCSATSVLPGASSYWKMN